jgi:ABC-type transporter Mla maintaining outer membrane lipid asymmetry ATPase subunit MlaF
MKFKNLKFENLSFGYDLNHPILKNVSFDFPLGETVWIRGNSSSGKAVFIRLMSGAVAPTEGRILVNEQDIHHLGFLHYATILKDIGFGFDGTGLLVNQSLEVNLALGLRYHLNWKDSDIHEWLKTLMDVFDVYKLKDQRPAFVAQSVLKVFLLLRAFVMKPEMMIFVNPFASLDEGHRKKFIALISLFKEKHGLKHVFIISDDEVHLEKLNPMQIWIEDKKFIFEKERMSA